MRLYRGLSDGGGCMYMCIYNKEFINGVLGSGICNIFDKDWRLSFG